MGWIIKPLAALFCATCRGGWHMSAAEVERCGLAAQERCDD